MSGYGASAAIFFLLSFVASVLIQRYYTKKSFSKIPLLTHALIVLSNFVCLLPFPLLVLDVDAGITERQAYQSQNTSATDGSDYFSVTPSPPVEMVNPEAYWFRPIWYTIMGVTQLTAWVLLPIAQEYDNCGEFTPKRKLRRSIRENVKMYIIMGIVVGLLFAYIVFLKGLNTFTDILHLGVAAANSFGLLIIIIFLAAGLVGMPKMLWSSSDPKMELRRLFFAATDIQEDLDLAAMELAEIKAELISIDPRVSEEDRPYLAQMLELISETDRDVPLYHTASSRVRLTAPQSTTTGDVSTEHLEALNAKLRRGVKVATRMNYQWESLVRSCKLLDKVIHGEQASKRLRTKIWIRIRNPVFKTGAACSLVLTVLVLWSELLLPFQTLSDEKVILSVIELALDGSFHFVGSILFLFYMAACSYWATFRFKVFEVFHVLPSVSDAASLCFTATFLTRLIMPLCYNFLNIAGLVNSSTTPVVYSTVFGSMDVGAVLGQWFNQYLPIFIPIVAVLIQAKVFDKLLALIGVEVYDINDSDSPTVQQRIRDGRRLVMAAAGRDLTDVNRGAGGSESTTTPTGTGGDRAMTAVEVSGASNASGSEVKGQRYKEYLAKKAAAAAAAGEAA